MTASSSVFTQVLGSLPSDDVFVAAGLTDKDAILARLAAGARVVLVGPDPGLLAAFGGGEPVRRARPDEPLVADEVQVAHGVGTWAGLHLSVTEPLRVQGYPLAVIPGPAGEMAADVVVAAAQQIGPGTLVVLSGRWHARLADADNARALARAILGRSEPAVETRIEELLRTPGLRPSHPEVEVLIAKDWDLSLVGGAGHDVNARDFARAAGHATRLLPAEVHDALVDFADEAPDAGAMVIRGVPVGDVPATPPSPTSSRKADRVSEHALLTVARRLGQPVGYLPEHGGDLVQNVVPVKANATRQVSTSSATVLEFHTEAAFHPHRPRYLLLLCLRGDPDAATTLCSVRAVTEALSPRERAILTQPRFTTGIDESYSHGPTSARSLPRPILTGDAERPKLWLDADLMRGTDPEAQQALERLSQLVREQASAVTLQTGDLLVVDNDVAVHGRSPFTPRFDGTDRWLQRTFVVADHTAADGHRDGRIIGTRFVG